MIGVLDPNTFPSVSEGHIGDEGQLEKFVKIHTPLCLVRKRVTSNGITLYRQHLPDMKRYLESAANGFEGKNYDDKSVPWPYLKI